MKIGQETRYRESCQICETPAPLNADLTLVFFGYDPAKEVLLMAADGLENELQEKLSLDLKNENPPEREKVIEKVIEGRKVGTLVRGNHGARGKNKDH